MEKYTAFISYRHKPVDMAVAARLHKLLERYTVPKALRKDGQKRLGKVFRDRDELSLDSDLTQRLRDALDASEYLIVICTPDTPASPWVAEEIRYFKTHHDESRVFTVVADGKSDETFPAALTQSFDSDGNVIEGRYHQPLAANIAAESDRERMRKLDDEFLRLVAPMLGCGYDTLYRREVRYRRKRRFAALSAAAAVAVAIVSVVLVKNAQIRRQFLQTQINESNALAKVSLNELQEGNAYQALKTAYSAVPGETERPLTLDAQIALAKSLYAYRPMAYRADISIEQWSTVKQALFSADGSRLAVLDDFNSVFMFNADTGELIWNVIGEVQYNSGEKRIAFFEDQSALAFAGVNSAVVYDAGTGEILRTLEYSFEENGREKTGLCFDPVFSPDGRTLACVVSESNGSKVMLYDLQTGERRRSDLTMQGSEIFVENGIFSDDGKSFYIADLNRKSGTEEILSAAILRTDTATGHTQILGELQHEAHWYNAQLFFVSAGEKHGACTVMLTSDMQDLCVSVRCENTGEWHSSKIDGRWTVSGKKSFSVQYKGSLYIFSEKTVIALNLETFELKTRDYDTDFTAMIPDETTERIRLVFTDGSLWEFSPVSYGSDGYIDKSTIADFEISAAYGGEQYGKPIVLIPARKTNTLCVFRVQGDTNLTQAAQVESVEKVFSGSIYGNVYPMPQDDRFLYLDSGLTSKDENGNTVNDYKLTVFSGTTGEVLNSYSYSGVNMMKIKGVSPDGRLIWFSEGAYDTETGTFTEVEDLSEDLYLSSSGASGPVNGGAYQLHAVVGYKELFLWKDGKKLLQQTLPDDKQKVFPEDDYVAADDVHVKIGGSGLIAVPVEHPDVHNAVGGFLMYSVNSGMWASVDYEVDPQENALAYTVAEQNEWLAVAEPDNMLRIYGMKGKIGEIPLRTPVFSIAEMQFIMDDSVLVLHQCSADHKTGHRIWLIRVKDGEIMQSLDLRDFDEFSELNVQWDAGRGLLFIGDRTWHSEQGCLLETETFTVLYDVPCAYCYLPGCARVVMGDTGQKALYTGPVYDIDTLTAWAEQKLNKTGE